MSNNENKKDEMSFYKSNITLGDENPDNYGSKV